MRRLEYTRNLRSMRTHARNAAEAVLLLAHVARERQRLEQERKSLEKRMRRIELRLTQIAGAETRLVPVIAGGRAAAVPGAGAPTPGGNADLILHY
jgi:hypothetical protein